jgi:WD40 repeat protein
VAGIVSIAWSHDSKYLAVCGSIYTFHSHSFPIFPSISSGTEQPNGTGCFLYYVPTGRLVKEYTHYAGDSFTTVSFFKDKSYRLACAGQKGHFHVYVRVLMKYCDILYMFQDVNRPEESPKTFEGFRVRCLYACKDGRTVLAADTHNRQINHNQQGKNAEI